MMNKKMAGMILSMLMVTGTVMGAVPTSAAGDTIKIGLTVPLSGDRASEGSYATNALELVVEEINSAGGVLGKDIEVVVQDTTGTDVGATNAYLKLAADDDIVAIIGSDNSNDNIAIAASAEASQILTTTQGSSPTLQETCEAGEWLFQLRACDSTLCAALMDYAVNEMGSKSFTIIHDTETASADQARLFQEGIEANGGTVDEVIPFTNGTKDFTAQLSQAMQSDSDALVVACLQTEAAILIQQAKALGIEKPIYGSNAFGDPVTVDLAGESINDAYSITAWVPDSPNEMGAEFSKKYEETYDEACAKAAAQIRDHIYVICEAIETAGSTDRTEVRDAMLTLTNYEGAITTYDCSLKGNCGKGGLIVQVKDLIPTVVEEITTK
ncbi:ABC transporter substrate-binding protein [Parablautia sp. Marseille-Q6255]|uniref:ABC transporter substrate-binding protein n=1 Tax=Parablautia sp. Marseille-Q6255 TaxID=3039593 RepID=UPI0024BC446B|nr:ABC transporter substrate-binding protein [Parablautia sp. Marseille-Q6255]